MVLFFSLTSFTILVFDRERARQDVSISLTQHSVNGYTFSCV